VRASWWRSYCIKLNLHRDSCLWNYVQILRFVERASLYNLVNKTNLVRNLFVVYVFINFYMFRTTMCPSSGEITVFLRRVVLVILCGWLSGMQGAPPCKLHHPAYPAEIDKGKKVKVKWSRYRPSVAQRVGRGIALLFNDRGTRMRWVVSITPRPHFTPGKDRIPILQEAVWVPGPVWPGGKSRPHRNSMIDKHTKNKLCTKLGLFTRLYVQMFVSIWRAILCLQSYRFMYSSAMITKVV